MNISEYAKLANRGELNVTDEWKHKRYLLDSEHELVTEFTQIIDGQIRLANLGSKEELGLEQLQVFNIMDLFHMSLKEPSLLPVFRYCYYTWKGGLGLSRAKKGRERGLQAMGGTSGNVPTESEGFMQQADDDEAQQESQLFNKIAGVRPKPKKIETY